MTKNKVEIVWFKRDLRLSDNQALFLASKTGIILPIYIFEPDLWRQPDHSYRHYIFLKKALSDLDANLSTLNAKLSIFVGNALEIFNRLNSQFEIHRIWSHQETWNLWTYDRDRTIKSWTRDNRIDWIEAPKNGIIRSLDDRNGWSRK